MENEGLDNQDEVQEQVQTPEMDQAEDQPSEDSFSDAPGMEAAEMCIRDSAYGLDGGNLQFICCHRQSGLWYFPLSDGVFVHP